MSILTDDFKPTATVLYASTLIEFMDAARRSPKNDSLIYGDKNGPHKFIYLDSDTGPKEFFFIQEPDGEISAIAITYKSSIKADDMRLMGVSVLSEYRDNGYGKSLIRAFLSRAQQEDRLFVATDFTHLGWKYLSPIATELHREFPNVKIQYNPVDEPVTGFVSYRLEQNQGITRVIEI